MQLYAKPPQRNLTPIVVPDDVPAYQILGGKFYGVNSAGYDELYVEGAVILYWGEPNLQMKPLNSLAWKETDKFLDKLDRLGALKAKEEKKGYVSVKASFKAAHAPAKRTSSGVVMLGRDEQTPLMGNKHRKQGQVQTIQPEEQAAEIHVVSGADYGAEKELVNAIANQ